jgi:hypothetical protein
MAKASAQWRRVGGVVIVVELIVLAWVASSAGSAVTSPSASRYASARVTAGEQSPPPLRDPRPVPTTSPPAPLPVKRTSAQPPSRGITNVPTAFHPVPTSPPPAPPPPAPPPPAPAMAPAAAGHGILPPENPPASLSPTPNFLSTCSSAGLDESAACTDNALAAIDTGRRAEGLAPMSLPGNWGALTPSEQLFVATNLERTVRGLPALSAMASVLDQAATAGAAQSVDPAPPSGFPFSQWGASWAGGVGSPLEAVYDWMYDDGPGSSNSQCTASDDSGCWGHRDKILMSLSCDACVMGTGFAPRGWQGQPSWAELLVGGAGSPPVDFTWQEEAAYL